MRRLSNRALALLMSFAPATLASAALAQEPSAPASLAPPAAAAPAAPNPGAPPLAPPPSELAPNADTPADAPPTPPAAAAPAPATPAAAAPAPATPAVTAAAASAPAAPVAQPKPLPARVIQEIPDAAPAPEAAPIPSVAAWLGINTLWIPSDGYDIFADDDALTLFDLGAAVSLVDAGALDVAAVLSWGVASSDADYRTQAASLDVMRFSAGPELRGSIVDRLYWHGRLSPTATRLAANLDESSSRASLGDERWAFGLDAAVGLDLRFAEAATPLPAALGFFVRVEAGYAWTQSIDLELQARDGAPVRSEALALPELALGGPALRASVGAGF